MQGETYAYFLKRAAVDAKGLKFTDRDGGEVLSETATYVEGVMKSSGEELEKTVRQFVAISKQAGIFGGFALLSIMIAFVFFLIFAVKNAPLL